MRHLVRPGALALLALGAALALAPASALAQDRSGTVEISPFGGAYFGGQLDAGTNAIFAHDVDIDNAGMWGLRLAFNTTRWFGIEFAYSHAKADIRGIGSTVLWGNNQKLGTLDHQTYDANAVFNFGRGRVIGYFSIGGGASRLDAQVPNVDSSADLRFAGNIGGGVKVFVDPHFGFRFDGRWKETYLNSTDCHNGDYYCDDHYHDDYYHSDGHWYGSGEATAGLVIAF